MVTGVAFPDDRPEVCGRRSGLWALLGAAVERAVTGIEGIPVEPPGVGGSVSAYRDSLVILLRSGLGALLEFAVESAVGVEGHSEGVENPVPGMDRDMRGLRATRWWISIEVDCSVSRSLIH